MREDAGEKEEIEKIKKNGRKEMKMKLEAGKDRENGTVKVGGRNGREDCKRRE